jgi:hypothetical protein
MNRLWIAAVVVAAGALAAGAWYWQTVEPVSKADESLPSHIETRKLEVGLEEQRQHLNALNERLDSGLSQLDKLEQRALALDSRFRERLSAEPVDNLPRTLEEIVARRTEYLESRNTTDDHSIRIQALSSDTGIPEDKIREALAR